MRTLTCFMLLFAASFHSGQAYAYGYQGHQLIGAIASTQLNPHAAKHVRALLGTVSLSTAAPWADCVRSVKKNADGTYKYTKDPHHPEYETPCVAFDTAARHQRMESYARRNWSNCEARPGHGCHESYHFADIAIQRGGYDPKDIGAADHDVVHAVNACIAKLRGQPVPAPFSIRDKKEALLLLTHFVGDLHQPLHVGAVYLEADGKPSDPDADPAHYDPKTSTAGGNLIADGSTNLHHDWDEIAPNIPSASDSPIVKAAAAVEPPHSAAGPLPIEQWAATWASETVVASRDDAYKDLAFAKGPDGLHPWAASFPDHAAYMKAKEQTQFEQMARAGKRLADILNAVWP